MAESDFETAAEITKRRGISITGAPASAALEERQDLAPDRIDVIRRLFSTSKDQLTDAEIAYVLSEAARTKLDPIRQLAVWRDRWTGKIVTHTKIDGLLAIAQRTGHYAGTGPTVLTWIVTTQVGKTTVLRPMREGIPPDGDPNLIAATCTVYRNDFASPVEVTRFWADSAPKEIAPNSAWDRMAALMLEKVALAGALRRAFPQDLAGLYESAEIDQ